MHMYVCTYVHERKFVYMCVYENELMDVYTFVPDHYSFH